MIGQRITEVAASGGRWDNNAAAYNTGCHAAQVWSGGEGGEARTAAACYCSLDFDKLIASVSPSRSLCLLLLLLLCLCFITNCCSVLCLSSHSRSFARALSTTWVCVSACVCVWLANVLFNQCYFTYSDYSTNALSLSHSLPINMWFLLSLSCFVARTVIKAFALHLNFCTFGAHLSKNAPKLFSILFLWQIFVVFAALTVYWTRTLFVFCFSTFVLGKLLHFFDHRQMSTTTTTTVATTKRVWRTENGAIN